MASKRLTPIPFCHQGPIQDHELFFNRDADVKRVLDLLRKGQSVSVVGKEKIGKTSFLHYVSNSQVAVRHGFTPQRHLFFYVDCKWLTDLGEDDCFDHIKSVLEKTVSTWEVRSVLSLEGIVHSNAYYWLEQALLTLKKAGIQSVVQIDDFDLLAANARLSLRFFELLRALDELHNTVAYLTTSRVPLFVLLSEVPRIAGSPFPNIFQQHELRPFDPDETRRFLNERLELLGAVFPDRIRELVYDLSRCEPHRLQVACDCACAVWRENRCSLCDEHCGEIEKRFNDVLQLASGNSI